MCGIAGYWHLDLQVVRGASPMGNRVQSQLTVTAMTDTLVRREPDSQDTWGIVFRHVTVSLSGDAGDELFGGYSRYFKCVDIWQKIDRLSMQLRRLCAGLMRALPPAKWNALVDSIGRVLPPLRQIEPGDKIQRVGNTIDNKRPLKLYAQLVSLCQNPTQIVLNSTEPKTPIDRPPAWLESHQSK